MLPRILPALVASGVVLVGAAACGSDNPGATAGATIAVVATDTECKVAQTEASAGTVTFKITNNGTTVNEFYVYGEGDRVIGEVENIAPGLSRELRVELTAGTYQTACKPGMTGAGIRGTFTITGAGTALGPPMTTGAGRSSNRFDAPAGMCVFESTILRV